MATENVEVKVNVSGDGQAAKSVGSIKKEIKEAQAEALRLSRQFGELSPQAQAAVDRIAELRDEIADLNERVELADPGAKFKAFGNAIASVAAGFQAVQGAMAVFGGESDELQKQLVKLQGAMNITEGLSTIADSWKDFQRLGAVIKTNVVSAFSTLRSAIITTGIGVLIVALGIVIANFDKIEAWLKKLFPAFEGFGKLFDKIKAIAMGAFSVIVEYFKIIGDIIGDLFTGDFKGAIKTAGEAGKRLGDAYVKGFNDEVADQIQEAARKATEALIKAQENDLKVLRAYGATREKESDALELEIAKNKVKITKDGTKEDREAQAAAFAELQALRIQQEQKEGQRQVEILKNRQALELQSLQDAGKSTIGIRESQLQVQLALEKKYGLDTKGTIQEILQAREADRKAAFDKELLALQRAQDTQLQAATIAGKNIYELRLQQFEAQLSLYRKFGYDTKEIQQKQAQDELARRKQLNDSLQTSVHDHNAVISKELINIAGAQQQLTTDTTNRIAEDAVRLDEIEKKKQKAISDTSYVLSQSAQAGEDRSEVEGAASAVLAVSMIADELSKQDALQATSSVLKTATTVLGQQTAIGKGVAIADATISTYQAAQSSFTALSPIPIVGPALGAIAAAAAVVAGVARVKKIISTQVPGAGSGASAGAAPSMPAPPVPTIQPNATTLLQQQIAQQSAQNATRVYVLESDITDKQKRVASIEENAKF
ncbi:hypothetical protein FHW36_10673 [Chitinophaga polysaccharea]|uniref:Tail length tape measure protein n=1 Tax=Chitinophaga polysaccharea TaxID=1293035 RepID=A0A561PL90_9BACT|nr:hypothetical protein [Chitinophaga polysaccharea]TWF38850.1 hypothetical protein FHW36_10673 [Chitinophaga polysaccharea]